MSIYQLIYRNTKQNIRHYGLYFFALVFSVGLYFAFLTLQFDASMGSIEDSIKVSAAIQVASMMLLWIVAVFLIYANQLLIKRRSKEIGLYQLVGMTKHRIAFMLAIENAILYLGSLLLGVFAGYLGSKLLTMILYKLTGLESIVELNFSTSALRWTIVVFSLFYLLLMIMTTFQIKRQTLLSLFLVRDTSETAGKRITWWQMVIGIAGILLILFGYYLSTRLFSGDYDATKELMVLMLIILASCIVGTYLFFKGSVTFLLMLFRKRKGGYLSIKQVLSLGSIMFRMRTNAFLLTVITTVSALAIGFLSLAYITYYSVGKDGDALTAGADFVFLAKEDANNFEHVLKESGIQVQAKETSTLELRADLTGILAKGAGITAEQQFLVIPDSQADMDVSTEKMVLTGQSDRLKRSLKFQPGEVHFLAEAERTFELIAIHDTYQVPSFLSFGALIGILNEADYRQLEELPSVVSQSFFKVTVQEDKDKEEAAQLFQEQRFGNTAVSKELSEDQQKMQMGLYLFLVGFLGLTFLITSGSILYIKQMDEGDSEQQTYTVLRKIGYTKTDLRKGIVHKQLFNFGIPLLIGLSHSYFAVKSGWFWFGSSLWIPMLAVMVIYTLLYSIFGALSVMYYKQVIARSL
ncbi:ABC transporter permease [Terribacillus sp. AE2B 122]|uniref:ABC transporter permease n=1 Tax=Terribacillus sp. AE2B 122 TaxID=1331902 RepID=UPI00144037B5|nr:ABC transporter permease [Terribacillus sp. AE2B 122]VVM33974.1 Bacitracin export permease protein BceB [Terribacillus sp. AE2B 122]